MRPWLKECTLRVSGPTHGISKGFGHTPLALLPCRCPARPAGRGPVPRGPRAHDPRASAVDSELKATSSLGQSQQIWFPLGRAGVCVCVCARPARGERRCTLAPRPRGRRARRPGPPRGAAPRATCRCGLGQSQQIWFPSGRECVRDPPEVRGGALHPLAPRPRRRGRRARRPGPPRGAARARPVGAVVPGVKLFQCIKIRLQTVFKVRHDALPHGTLVRAPSDECRGGSSREQAYKTHGESSRAHGWGCGWGGGGAKRQGAREHTRVSSLTACQPRSCTTCSRGGGQRSAAREHGVWRASWVWARTASSRVC